MSVSQNLTNINEETALPLMHADNLDTTASCGPQDKRFMY